MQQRRQPGAAVLAATNGVAGHDLEKDIEVPDRTESSPDRAEVAAVATHRLTLEPVAEDSPGGTHAASRDAHRVDVLRVLASNDTRHAREQPGKVEPQDPATGLCPLVIAADAGRPTDREAVNGQS